MLLSGRNCGRIVRTNKILKYLYRGNHEKQEINIR